MMIARFIAFDRMTDPLIDPPKLFSRNYELAVLPRVGEWIESLDFEDEDAVLVVKSILHSVREYPRRINPHASSLDQIEPSVEIILEPR